MKRILLFFICLAIYTSIVAQDKFNGEQLKLRSDIESFLREEGFMPQIDSDGDIAFKKDGDRYYVIIDSRDTSPFYITLSKFYSYGEGLNRHNISEKLDELNLKKAVKVLLNDKSYVLQSEMFIINAESFKYVFYKLLNQIEALEEEVNILCSDKSDAVIEGEVSIHENGGTYLVNEDFSSYPYLWKNDGGKVSYKNGKMIFEDIEDYGYSELIYNLPQNLKNEDFQLDLSMKVTFHEENSSLFFILGNAWDDAYRFGLTLSSKGLIELSYGTYGKSTKYYGYSSSANLGSTAQHQYTMIKKGKMVEWYADGKFLFSTTIDMSTDMNLIGFLVSSYHLIEVDNLTIKLL